MKGFYKVLPTSTFCSELEGYWMHAMKYFVYNLLEMEHSNDLFSKSVLVERDGQKSLAISRWKQYYTRESRRIMMHKYHKTNSQKL